MEILLGHVKDPLGSGVTLTQLLSQNEQLMAEYATESLAEDFVSMIRTIGPELVSGLDHQCPSHQN